MYTFSHAVRVLAKKPGFTAAAVLVLALGIGANTAIFSLVNAFLLKPLKIYQKEQLVGLYSRDTKKPDNYRAFSYPNFTDLRAQGGVFTSVAAHNLAMVGLTEGDSTPEHWTQTSGPRLQTDRRHFDYEPLPEDYKNYSMVILVPGIQAHLMLRSAPEAGGPLPRQRWLRTVFQAEVT